MENIMENKKEEVGLSDAAGYLLMFNLFALIICALVISFALYEPVKFWATEKITGSECRIERGEISCYRLK
jgi:hypothetical protein